MCHKPNIASTEPNSLAARAYFARSAVMETVRLRKLPFPVTAKFAILSAMPLNASVKNVLRHARYALRQKVIQAPATCPQRPASPAQRQLRIASAHQPAVAIETALQRFRPPGRYISSSEPRPFLPLLSRFKLLQLFLGVKGIFRRSSYRRRFSLIAHTHCTSAIACVLLLRRGIRQRAG